MRIDGTQGTPNARWIAEHELALNSLSDSITKLATMPGLHGRQSLGVRRRD
ncbi:MAG: hypothetical protein KIS78_00285 [Labilithrix sp.]|nr:hypothetical protein [Labilithrix sp.]